MNKQSTPAKPAHNLGIHPLTDHLNKREKRRNGTKNAPRFRDYFIELRFQILLCHSLTKLPF